MNKAEGMIYSKMRGENMKIGNYKREFDQYLLTKKQNNYFPKNLPRMINKNKMVFISHLIFI